MFDDPFDALEIPKFLKAFQRLVEEFLHVSILSLKYVRFADFIRRCDLFLKRQKVLKFSAVLCFLKLYNDLSLSLIPSRISLHIHGSVHCLRQIYLIGAILSTTNIKRPLKLSQA